MNNKSKLIILTSVILILFASIIGAVGFYLWSQNYNEENNNENSNSRIESLIQNNLEQIEDRDSPTNIVPASRRDFCRNQTDIPYSRCIVEGL